MSPDLAALAPETRRALASHAPDYLALAPEARERRRAQWGVADAPGIRNHLLAEALGKTSPEIAAIESDDAAVSDADLTRLNTLLQQIRGIGDDFFSWNESLAEGETALSFATIGAYDRADHAFQEYAAGESDPSYVARPYRGRLSGEWARYLDRGRIRYAVLSDAAAFVATAIESAAFELLAELVPHRLKAGPDHGRPAEGGFVIWDMRLDAAGYEALHRAVSDAAHATAAARLDTLREQAWTTETPTVWMLDATTRPRDDDPDSVDIVFSGPEAMNRVRPRRLLADCAALAGDPGALTATVEAETARFADALRRAHAELSARYPHGSAPPEPARRVRAAPGVPDDLAPPPDQD